MSVNSTRASRRPGFTLTEMLVAISTISLLVVILLPSLQSARAQARSTFCQANLRAQTIAISEAANAANGQLPYAYDKNPKSFHYRAIAYAELFSGGHLTHSVETFANTRGTETYPAMRVNDVMMCPRGENVIGGSTKDAINAATRNGGAINGSVRVTAGANRWLADVAGVVDGKRIFSHYSINGAWGYALVHNNLYGRLAFQTNIPAGEASGIGAWFNPPTWKPNAPRSTVESIADPSGLFLAGDAMDDYGLLRPVFRHQDQQANFAFVDGHTESIAATDLRYRKGAGGFIVDDERLWTAAPSPGLP